MGKWQAAYWGEKGVDIYQMSGQGNIQLLYSGSIDKLKNVSGGRQRRILILGRHNTVRLRKRYPPLKINKLLRAVEIEAQDIFPVKNCSFHCKIAETYATHIIVDIWAWERAPVEALRASFTFQYILPEELTFLSSPSGIYIYSYGLTVQIIAAGDGKFLEAASCPAADFSKENLELFLTGLSDNISLIKEIRFYGSISVDVSTALIPLVKKLAIASVPPFLEALKNMPIKSFRWEKGFLLRSLNIKTVLRFALYGALAYGLMLFLSLQNYEKALADLKNKSLAIDKEISLLNNGQLPDDAEALKEVEAKKIETIEPLKVLNILSSELPEETYVKSLLFNQGIIEATFSTHDPIALLKKLSGTKRIASVRLNGVPVKDSASGIYNTVFSLEIKP